jgi:hypothetical protein
MLHFVNLAAQLVRIFLNDCMLQLMQSQTFYRPALGIGKSNPALGPSDL